MESNDKSLSSSDAGHATSATSGAAEVFETDEELQQHVAHYDALHHTEELSGSFASKAALGGRQGAGRGPSAGREQKGPPLEGEGGGAAATPERTSPLDPGVGEVCVLVGC
jgi:hypothetical protein